MHFELPHLRLQLDIPDGIDAPKLELMRALTFALPFAAGQSVLDLGCGAGLYTALALQAGCTVLATDVEGEALAVTRDNIVRNRLPLDRLAFGLGDLFAAAPPHFTCDVIVANLPQTPCLETLRATPAFRASKWAGAEGLLYIERLLAEFATYLKPDGALLMLQIGWLDWRSIDERLATRGFTCTTLGVALRTFEWQEYETYAPGLAEYLQVRVARGVAQSLQHTATQDGERLAFPVRWVVYRRPPNQL